MKEVEAFIHRRRVADVVRALDRAGFRHLSVIDIKGTLQTLGGKEQVTLLEAAGCPRRFATAM